MSKEHRQFIRIREYLLTLVRFAKTGNVYRALTKDIGGNGLRLLTEELIDAGAPVEVEIKLPDREEPIRFTGEVVWSKLVEKEQRSYKNPKAETGVKFLQIDPGDRTIITQYAKLNALPGDEGARD